VLPNSEVPFLGPGGVSLAPKLPAQPAAGTEPVLYRDLSVAKDERVVFPAGEVRISGDFANAGTVVAGRSSIVFDGADQTLSGPLVAKKIILRGGVKRLRGAFSTNGRTPSVAGEAHLVVEAGTTLLIEEHGSLRTFNAYGYQIAGHLVIDGGTFRCAFFNGTGKPNADGVPGPEDSWLPGSTLTIRGGKFVSGGDADFRGATVTLHAGELHVDDDLWSLGDAFVMYGGLVRNSKRGGAFQVTGSVQIYGGEVHVQQSSRRGLFVTDTAVFGGTGGTLRIRGSAGTRGEGGMRLLTPLSVANLSIETNTRIHPESSESAHISVANTLTITKGKSLHANGRLIYSSFTPNASTGQIVP